MKLQVRKGTNCEEKRQTYTLHLTDGFFYNRFHALAMEYNISMEHLADLAVKHLVEDIELVGNLRIRERWWGK